MEFLLMFLLGLVLNAIAYFLMPKPKQSKPDSARAMDDPTADAGRPIPVLFGEMIQKDPNVLWWGEKAVGEYQVDA